MKTRIIGSICVIITLLGLYVLTENTSTVQIQQSVPTSNDSAFKGLSIN